MLLIGVQPEELDDYGGSLRRVRQGARIGVRRSALDAAGRLGLTPRRRGHHGPTPQRDALAIGSYEAGRPSAEAACRLGDDALPGGLTMCLGMPMQVVAAEGAQRCLPRPQRPGARQHPAAPGRSNPGSGCSASSARRARSSTPSARHRSSRRSMALDRRRCRARAMSTTLIDNHFADLVGPRTATAGIPAAATQGA